MPTDTANGPPFPAPEEIRDRVRLRIDTSTWPCHDPLAQRAQQEILMAVAASRSRERVARNFVKTYGRTKFRRLLEALAIGESGQVIADEFGVSRERVRQWKNTFGEVITHYRVYPEVDRILQERRGAQAI
jgi:hypothetical protein